MWATSHVGPAEPDERLSANRAAPDRDALDLKDSLLCAYRLLAEEGYSRPRTHLKYTAHEYLSFSVQLCTMSLEPWLIINAPMLKAAYGIYTASL